MAEKSGEGDPKHDEESNREEDTKGSSGPGAVSSTTEAHDIPKRQRSDSPPASPGRSASPSSSYRMVPREFILIICSLFRLKGKTK